MDLKTALGGPKLLSKTRVKLPKKSGNIYIGSSKESIHSAIN